MFTCPRGMRRYGNHTSGRSRSAVPEYSCCHLHRNDNIPDNDNENKFTNLGIVSPVIPHRLLNFPLRLTGSSTSLGAVEEEVLLVSVATLSSPNFDSILKDWH